MLRKRDIDGARSNQAAIGDNFLGVDVFNHSQCSRLGREIAGQ